MAEKLGEAFVLMVLRDAAFRASLKSDEVFALKSAAAIQSILSKIRIAPVVMSVDTNHLKKSIDVAEAVVGVGMEKIRKLARIPTYMDARPMRKSLRVVATDVDQAFSRMSRQARLSPIFDARAMRSSMAQLQQAMGAMRAQQMSSMATMPAAVSQMAMPRQVTQPSRFRRMMGGGDGGGGMGAGGALLAGATGGLAATAGIRAFSMLEAKVKGLIRTGMDANATMERLGQSFEVMLGSAAAGKRVLESLRVFAEKTPFEMKDIAQVATMLLSTRQIAEDQLIPTIRKIGDAASGSSEGFAAFPRLTRAITQMMNKGKIQAEEMMQLSEAGVPAWQALAKAMGKTVPEVQKMSETGKLGLTEIMKLVDALGGQFEGLADKQSKTFEGLSSTWRDQLSTAVMKVSKPLFELSRLGLQNLTDWMNTDQAQKLITVLTQGMEQVMGKVKAVGISFVESAKKFDLSTITNVINKTLQIASKVVTVLTAAFSNPLVVAVSKFLALSGVISGVIAVAATFAPTIMAALSPVSMVVVGLTAGFLAVKKSIENALNSPGGERLRANISEIVSRVGNLASMLKDTVVPLVALASDRLAKMFSLGSGGSFWEKATSGVKDLIAGVETLAANWQNSWDAVKLIGNATVLEWWEKIKHLFNVQWPAIALGFWEGMSAATKEWGNSFLSTIQVVFDAAKEMFAEIFTARKNQYQATGEAAKGAWSTTGEEMLAARDRAAKAVKTTLATGGSKDDAMKAAAAEIAVGIDRSIGSWFGAGGKAVKAMTIGSAQESKAFANAVAKIGSHILERDAAIAKAFGNPIADRLKAAGGAPENADAKRMRDEAKSLLDSNAKKADDTRRKRESDAATRDRKEREAAGKAGIEEWLEKGKNALLGVGESLKTAMAGTLTPNVGTKKSRLEFTGSSELWQHMAKALTPTTSPMAKSESLLEKILDAIKKAPTTAGGVVGKVSGAVAGGVLGAGTALGRGIANPGSVAKAFPKGIAGALKGGIAGVVAGSKWLGGAASAIGTMNPDVADAVMREAKAQEEARGLSPAEKARRKLMEGLGGTGGMAGGSAGVFPASEARKKLLDKLNKSAPVSAADRAREALNKNLGIGGGKVDPMSVEGIMRDFPGDSLFEQPSQSPSASDTKKKLMDRLSSAMSPSGGAGGRSGEDPLMTRQNEILEKSNAIQQQIVGAVQGLAGSFGFAQ